MFLISSRSKTTDRSILASILVVFLPKDLASSCRFHAKLIQVLPLHSHPSLFLVALLILLLLLLSSLTWRTFCWIVLPEASSTRRGASMAGGRRGRTARTAPPARARSTITSRKAAHGTPPPPPLSRMRTPGRRYTRRRLSLSCRPTSHPSCRSRPPLPSMPLSPTHHLRHRHVPSGRRRPRPSCRQRRPLLRHAS